MNNKRTTFVVALPRSRTCWLNNLLLPAFDARHEVMIDYPDLSALRTSVDSDERHSVIVDTTAFQRLPEIRAAFPHAQYVVIRRDPAEIENSLAAIGMLPVTFDDLVEQFETEANVLSIRNFDIDWRLLSDPDIAEDLWDYLGNPSPFDAARHKWLCGVSVTLRMDAFKARMREIRRGRGDHAASP